jgi:hypothetical protein
VNWIDRWHSLSARIDGLLDAANFVMQALQVNNSFAPGTKRAFLDELNAIAIELRQMSQSDGANMPEMAARALAELVAAPPRLDDTAGFDANSLQAITPLFAFRARFDYLIRDSEIEGRNATELSFEHLRRLIEVDANTRAAWKKAFEKNEIACERLGSVHLLSHGIWAFKVQAGGAATDLVYNEPVTPQHLRRTSRAIVLTEWKIVRDPADADREALAARTQANDYAEGALGDLELKRTRYAVLVGLKKHDPPADIDNGRFIYRHIWLAVDPDTPSVHGRTTARCRAQR